MKRQTFLYHDMEMTSEQLEKLFASFEKMRILVVGDVMIDAYTEGVIERMSPEAPVPVVNVKKRYNRLGGAANVALNLKSLGAEPILCSVIGDDQKGEKFMQLLRRYSLNVKGIVKSAQRSTTLKERVIVDGKQRLRIDEEDTVDLYSDEAEALLVNLQKLLEQKAVHCIVLQDYNKGVLSPSVIGAIMAIAKQSSLPVVVDPKKDNFLAYQGASLFKPNAKELREGLCNDATDIAEYREAAIKLRALLNCDTVMVTLSGQGVIICRKDSDAIESHHLAAFPRDIKDVSGAGDTVLSVAALCTVAEQSAYDTAFLSNLAGGLVCEQIGVGPIDKQRLLKEAKELCDRHD